MYATRTVLTDVIDCIREEGGITAAIPQRAEGYFTAVIHSPKGICLTGKYQTAILETAGNPTSR